ncbi:MAG: DUF1080 domain-containing protein [Verrucomicrobiales bacterium]|jgi:hypothetical protein|nr:DUF1080 domain-containing protein [Verrucomicrobiales bacterium]
MKKFLMLVWLGLAVDQSSQAADYDVFNPHPDNTYTADGKWKLHDRERPQPPRVAPDEARQRELAIAPADAVRLDFSKWKDTRIWHDEGGVIVSRPAPRDLESLDSFGSVRLHLEWMAPADSPKTDQNRANSGVFLMNTYEVQILDTHENVTYADGMAGALYAVKPPDANPLRPSGEWQAYDIWFKRPTFDDKGAMVTPACVTVYINGVLAQNNAPFDGESVYQPRKPYRKHADKLSLRLQFHNEVISFRNIWVQPIDNDEVMAPAGRLGGYERK